MNRLIILFALVSFVFAQYGPGGPGEFDGGAMGGGPGQGEEYAAQPDFEGGDAEVPFESTQGEGFEGGEYGPGPGGIQGGMMQPEMQGPGGYQPEMQGPGGYQETVHRSRFMPFKK